MQKQLIRESLFQTFREFFHSRKFLPLKYDIPKNGFAIYEKSSIHRSHSWYANNLIGDTARSEPRIFLLIFEFLGTLNQVF